MGAKTWMLAYVDGNASEILKSYPELDRKASAELAKRLFPKAKLEPIADGNLAYTCPRGKDIYIGCFPGLSIIAAKEFGIDNPSKLKPHFISSATGGTVYLHAMHSVVDWFAYAIWENGKLKRSLSLTPDNGIIEDIGARLPFEEPFWDGTHPLYSEGDLGDYPLAFHPLDMAEYALLALFGYQLEGMEDPNQVQPENIPLLGFKRKSWWNFW